MTMRENTLIQIKNRLASMTDFSKGIVMPLDPGVWDSRKRFIIQSSKKLLREPEFYKAKHDLESIRDWSFSFAPSVNNCALPGQVKFAAGRVKTILSHYLGD